MKQRTVIKSLIVSVFLICIFCVIGCTPNRQAGQQGNGDSSMKMKNAPSVWVYSREELISLIEKADVSGYREEIQDDYNKMFKTIKKSGFIYLIAISEDGESKDAITLFERDGKNEYFLMAYNDIEDIGIVSRVMFRGKLYQVYVNCIDNTFAEKGQNISEYVYSRCGQKTFGQSTVRGKEVFYTFEGSAPEYDKNCSLSFIDSDHYLYVKTKASREDLQDFLELVELEKVVINNN